MAGVRLLPYMATLVTTVIAEGFIMSHLHRGKFLPWFYAGGALVLIGSALMYTVDVSTAASKIYGYSILVGTGCGAYLQMPFAVAQIQVHAKLIPVAVGFVAFAQLAAPAVTLSIANSVFLNEATSGIARILPEASKETIQRVISGGRRDYFDSLNAPTRDEVFQAIVTSMSKIYLIVIVSGALTLLLTTTLTLHNLFRRAMHFFGN